MIQFRPIYDICLRSSSSSSAEEPPLGTLAGPVLWLFVVATAWARSSAQAGFSYLQFISPRHDRDDHPLLVHLFIHLDRLGP